MEVRRKHKPRFLPICWSRAIALPPPPSPERSGHAVISALAFEIDPDLSYAHTQKP